MITAEQRIIRGTGVGGSESAALLGIDPYRNNVDVWLSKLYPENRAGTDSEPAYWGNVLEDIVAREWSKRSGREVRRNNQTLRHPMLPTMLAHIDRKVVGLDEGLECKTLNAFSGSQLTEPLDHHWVQCQHYLEVMDYERWHIAYLVGGQRFVSFEIERDRAFGSALIQTIVEFWGYVVRNEQPPFSHDTGNAKSINETLKRLYPGTNGETVDLSDLSAWHEVRMDAKRMIKKLEDTVDCATNIILDRMQESAIGELPDGSRYVRKRITRKGYTVEDSEYLDFRHLPPKRTSKA